MSNAPAETCLLPMRWRVTDEYVFSNRVCNLCHSFTVSAPLPPSNTHHQWFHLHQSFQCLFLKTCNTGGSKCDLRTIATIATCKAITSENLAMRHSNSLGIHNTGGPMNGRSSNNLYCIIIYNFNHIMCIHLAPFGTCLGVHGGYYRHVSK